MKFKEDFLLDNMRYSWKCTLYIDSFLWDPLVRVLSSGSFFMFYGYVLYGRSVWQ